MKNGAVPDTIEVQIEIDPQTSKITAIALGSTEVQTTDLQLKCGEEEGAAWPRTRCTQNLKKSRP